MPEVIIVAEFHAIWKDQNGTLHDVTPRNIPGINKILFIEDAVRVFSGQQFDNIKLALKNDSLITEFINNAETSLKAINRGELAFMQENKLTPEIYDLQFKHQDLLKKISEKFSA